MQLGPAMKASWTLIPVLLFCSAFQPSAVRAEGFCKALPVPVDTSPRLVQKPEFRYPAGQVTMLGEGWVRLAHSITPDGSVSNVRLVDIVGAPIFAHAAAGSLGGAKFAPARAGGRRVAFNNTFEVSYLIEGKNRAGVHAKIGNAYDAAAAARKFNDFERSLRILQDASKLTLNLYEYALTSYGLAMSYVGLGDRRRALLHIRRSTIAGGAHVDKGMVRSTFALLAELEARDGNPRAALCAFETLKKKVSGYAPSPALADLLRQAELDLSGTAPLLNDVELVESGREEIPTHWSHALLRDTFAFQNLQGNLKRYRVTCPTSDFEGDVGAAGTVRAGRSGGPCTLEVFGDPGAKFTLDER